MPLGQIVRLVDTFEFDTGECSWPHACHVAGNIYAIVYTSLIGTNHGIIKTFEIIDGQITEPAVSTYDFIDSACVYPNIVHIAGTTYCVVYRGADTYLHFRTFTIADNGQITQSEIETASYATYSFYPHIIKVGAGMYFLINKRTGGRFVTWTITDAGALGAEQTDYFDTGSVDFGNANLIHIADGIIYAWAYQISNALGYLCTTTVSALGDIRASLLGEVQIEAVACTHPFLIHVGDTTYACIYSIGATGGKLITHAITDAGTIAASSIEDYTWEAGACAWPMLCKIGPNVYGAPYQGPAAHGILKTFGISNAGVITRPFLDSLDFTDVMGNIPWMFPTTGDYFAIVYPGDGDDMFLKTFEITAEAPQLGHTELLIGLGP